MTMSSKPLSVIQRHITESIPIEASGSLATLPSQIILPLPSTTHRLNGQRPGDVEVIHAAIGEHDHTGGGIDVPYWAPQYLVDRAGVDLHRHLFLHAPHDDVEGMCAGDDHGRDAGGRRATELSPKESGCAESAQGISPRAAHRSGREPLDSSGSCHRMKAAAFH